MPQMLKAPHPALLGLFCAALLSGCTAHALKNPYETHTAILPQANNIGFGQKAYADGPIIEAVKLVEDSRCPQNARCVWAGRLVLDMRWYRGNGEAVPFTLSLDEPTHIADGHIEITSAPPPMTAGEPSPKPADYRFSFRFRGGI